MDARRPLCALFVSLLAPLPVMASETPAPLQEPPEESVLLGDFAYSANASLGYEYNDNIYATQDDTLSDTVLRASLAGNAASQWQRHVLKAGAGVTAARYVDYGTEDTTDYWGGLSGRYDFDVSSNLFGGLSYSRLHEVRGSIDAVSGDEPTLYTRGQANVGVKRDIEAVSLTLAGSLNRLDYRNTPAGAVELFNGDRDRDESSVGLRTSHALSSRWSVFAQLRSDVRDYALRVDDAGYERSSSGYRAGVGARLDLGRRLQGELMLGFLSQEYDDAAFDDIGVPDYQGSLSWFISDDSHLRVDLVHTLEETTLPGSPGYLYRQLGMQWRQRFTEAVFGKFGLAYGQVDYQQASIEDDYYDVSAGLTHPLHEGVFAGMDLRHLRRDSNIPGDDFERNVFSVSINGRF